VTKRRTKTVRDHFHLTNIFRGAAHTECNRNYRIPKFIPVVFHNISNYDSHLFIKKMFIIKNPEETLECIPNNEEKYISFRKEIVLCHITDEEGERIANVAPSVAAGCVSAVAALFLIFART